MVENLVGFEECGPFLAGMVENLVGFEELGSFFCGNLVIRDNLAF